MAAKTNRLLSKKTWTGEEVGRAVIEHLIDEYLALYDPAHRSSFEATDLERLKNSLSKEQDRQVYNRYIRLYDGLLDALHKADTMQQQLYHGITRLLACLESANIAAYTLAKMNALPAIVTKNQYEAMQANVRAKALGCMETPVGLFFHALSYYAGSRGSPTPKVPRPVQDAMKILKNTPFTNAKLFAKLAKERGEGYHLFEDGTRSKQLTKAQYQIKFVGDKGIRTGEYIFEQMELIALREAFKKRKQGVSWEIANREKILAQWPRWVDETELPASGLSKWDVVFGVYAEATRVLFCSGAQGDPAGRFKDFQEEFPEIVGPVVEALCRIPCVAPLFPDGKPAGKGSISWGALAEQKVLDYPDWVEPSCGALAEEFNAGKKWRDVNRSFQFAILEEGPLAPHSVHEAGEYKGPAAALREELFRLLDFQDSKPDEIQSRLIEPALCMLYACAEFVEKAGALYDFPRLGALAPPMADIESKLNALNDIVIAVYDQVKEDAQWEEHVVQSFNLIDVRPLKPRAQAIALVEDCLKDLDALGKGVVHGLLYEMTNMAILGGDPDA